MKRILMLTFLALLLSAGAATASVQCYQYIDSRAYSDSLYNFCWLSGSICYQCVNVDRGSGCAADWHVCDPNPPKEPENPVAGCPVESKPVLSPNPAAQRSRIERIAQLRAGQLL
jgi:hypothetical protein